MKVTINNREYELKELTKEQAKKYIGKEVYVWNFDIYDYLAKRKLLEVFMPECVFPFCVLRSDGKSACNYEHCAPVPEEWYVYEMKDGHYLTSNHEEIVDGSIIVEYVDHGSQEYCEQKVKELSTQETEEPSEQKEATEHPLTNYELAQLLKCFGVEGKFKDYSEWHGEYGYKDGTEKNDCPNDIIIRYKCGEWMPATRETVMKWYDDDQKLLKSCSSYSSLCCIILFMGWNKE